MSYPQYFYHLPYQQYINLLPVMQYPEPQIPDSYLTPSSSSCGSSSPDYFSIDSPISYSVIDVDEPERPSSAYSIINVEDVYPSTSPPLLPRKRDRSNKVCPPAKLSNSIGHSPHYLTVIDEFCPSAVVAPGPPKKRGRPKKVSVPSKTWATKIQPKGGDLMQDGDHLTATGKRKSIESRPLSPKSKRRRTEANTRERQRMASLKEAFDKLRLLLPIQNTNGLSKHTVIMSAINYIQDLQDILDNH